MKAEKIESIKLSLMEIVDDSNMEKGKADYVIRASAYIKLDGMDQKMDENDISSVVSEMYQALLKQNVNNSDVNYVGIWVSYDGVMYDNAIRKNTLDDIEKYSIDEVNSTYEFLKMSIPD